MMLTREKLSLIDNEFVQKTTYSENDEIKERDMLFSEYADFSSQNVKESEITIKDLIIKYDATPKYIINIISQSEIKDKELILRKIITKGLINKIFDISAFNKEFKEIPKDLLVKKPKDIFNKIFLKYDSKFQEELDKLNAAVSLLLHSFNEKYKKYTNKYIEKNALKINNKAAWYDIVLTLAHLITYINKNEDKNENIDMLKNLGFYKIYDLIRPFLIDLSELERLKQSETYFMENISKILDLRNNRTRKYNKEINDVIISVLYPN